MHDATPTFRTHVTPRQSGLNLQPDDKLFFIGSCFADEVSRRARGILANVSHNPYGTAYNPASIAAQIRRALTLKPFDAQDEALEENGVFHSFQAHSSLSARSIDELRDNINSATAKAHDDLRRARLIAITFGTAWVYELTRTRSVVANCHKQKLSDFTRRLMSVDEIINDWCALVEELKTFNPDAHIVLTISPIRHLKDTVHGNQVSKATLILAAEEIVNRYKDRASYFEAYELQLDDLRDYRFYARDMLHPSDEAADYIFHHFAQRYFSESMHHFALEARKVVSAVNHRPLNAGKDYADFIENTLQKAEMLKKKYAIGSQHVVYAETLKKLNDIKMYLKH